MIRTILKSLLKPEAYPEPTHYVEMLQTHVSWIFLTDSHAYKVKKAVDFGFLNFSTIDRRRFYCNEEVRLNRRLCPDIYEGVVELRETPGGAAFFGDGPIIDFAVRMKRMPAERMLDRMVKSNEISVADMREVARVIAAFHQAAPTSPAISEYGHLDRIMFNWLENLEQMIPFEDTTLPAGERERIREWVSSFAEENAELFSRRVDEGFIRECDGDIHLENICMLADRVCIFDCIEFNERFRCCDTAADVAFLLMDLDYHGRHDLAGEVIAAYLAASGDSGMTALIDFYKIYRAVVRGKVESFRLNDHGIERHERERAAERATRYFRLARGYIERRGLRPTLFITCGVMGCGKSTLAEQLCFELGIAGFSSDAVRKRLAGLQPGTPVPEAYAAGLYDRRTSDAVYAELIRLAEAELASGRSVLLDASFMRRADRSRCATLAERCSAAFVILRVTCGDAENRRRLTERSASGRSVSDGRVELLDQQRQAFEPPGEEEGLLITLIAAGSPASLTNQIYGRLS
ncbi:MAG: AAA family ATPase [Deltaproteobacteria bacterium]|nr:AAA family ATPase [Deltaproteobacteria bacterium]